MTGHATILDDLDMNLQEFEEWINNLPSTEAGLPGFEVTNVPVVSENLLVIEEQIYQVPEPAPMIIGGFGVENVENVENVDIVREYEAFGVKLNDTDDVISVGLVLLVVGLIYIGKSTIDYWFATRLERFKQRIEKE